MPSLSRTQVALVDPITARLERPGDWSSWSVPEVHWPAAGETAERSRPLDQLWWRASERPRRVRPRPGLLEEFLRLADDESGERIFRYAQRWGVLEICQHGLPCSHNPPPWNHEVYMGNLSEHAVPFCQPLTVGNEVFRQGSDFKWESMEVWRAYARVFRTLVDIAGRLGYGEVPSSNQWRALFDNELLGHWPETLPYPRKVATAAGYLAEVLSDLLTLSGARPQAILVGDRPAVTVGGGDLFGALTMQALMAASTTEGFYFCSGCSRPFATVGDRRRPQAGRNHYCPQCGTSAARRDASRRYRERLRSSRPRGAERGR
jgi:DNA-directed RNA polymerase subunit RPC12/RpoP